MRPIVSRIAILAAFLAVATAAQAQAREALPVAQLEARLPAILDSAGIPGLAIAVIEDGRLAWSGVFGVRNVDTGAPIGPETLFEAASLTKPVFGYALLKLVDRGEFDLDRPLSEYVAMDQFGDDPRVGRITGRMVLSHTSGFSGFAEGGRLTMASEPGERFRYFGDAWLPLQRAVEAATGDSAHVIVAREVFEPLGMQHSSFVFPDTTGDYATPHNESGRPLEKRTWTEAHIAATLHTTAPDYARFMIAALAGTGLSEESARAFLTSQVSAAPGVSWGLGVGLQDDAPAMWQWGHWFGTRAFMIGFPASRSGVVYLANSDGGLSIRDVVVGTLFGTGNPAVTWLGYEQYDSRTRQARLELRQRFVDGGVVAGLALLSQLEASPETSGLTENMLNALGYDLMGSGHLDAAIAVFEANVRLYPSASNTYDSLGEAYLAAGRLQESLANYRRSVELDPMNDNGRAAIQRIEERLRTGT